MDKFRHKKRGGIYEVIGDAEVQNATGQDIDEGTSLTIYRDKDGKLWARATQEFHDGRFEPVKEGDAT